MSDLTLALGLLFTGLVATVYFYVGNRLQQRRVSADMQLPVVAFAFWWQSLAILGALEATMTLASWQGWIGTDVFVAVRAYMAVLGCLAVGALLFYLLFLFTGKVGWWRPLLALVSLQSVFALYLMRAQAPSGVTLLRWNAELAYAEPLGGGTALVAFAVIGGPLLLGTLAFASLAVRTRERTIRYRILVVSLGLLAWLGISLLGTIMGQDGNSPWEVVEGRQTLHEDVWHLLSHMAGLAAAGLVLAAYYPPAKLRRHWNLVSIDEPLPGWRL